MTTNLEKASSSSFLADHTHRKGPSLAVAPSPTPDKDRGHRGGSVAFADQCVLIPVGYTSDTCPYSKSPPRGSSSSAASQSLQLPTGLHSILLRRAESEPPLLHASPRSRSIHQSIEIDVTRHIALRDSLQPSHKRSWSSSDLPILASIAFDTDVEPSTSLRNAGITATSKGILKTSKQNTVQRESQLSSSHTAVAASKTLPTTSFANAPMTPPKVHPTLSLQVTLQSPTPQKPVATPKATYRPLKLGCSSDDEESAPTPLSVASYPPLPATVPTRSREAPRNGEGPPVVHAPNVGGEYQVEPQYAAGSTTNPGKRALPLSRNGRCPNSYLALGGLSHAQSSACKYSSTAAMSRDFSVQPVSLYIKMDVTSLPPTSTRTSLTRSVSDSSHLVRSHSDVLRPEWLRWGRRLMMPVTENSDTTGGVSDTEEAGTDGRDNDVAQLVPLTATCVCQHCEGRIAAGLSAAYVPHWSKAARSKWLADRRQVAQSGSSAYRVQTQALSLSGGPPRLVPTEGVRQLRSMRSPPPTLSSQIHETLPTAVGSHQSFRGKVTYHPVQRTQTFQPFPGAGDEGDAGDGNPTVDLQQIWDRQGSGQDADSDTIQVDEVDEKRGLVSRPRLLGGLPSPDLNADAKESSAFWEAVVPRRSTPLGLNEDEIIDGDASLAPQVELEIMAREERLRNESVRKRGGARGMMALLEEADTQEAIAREQRLHRISSTPDQSLGSLAVAVDSRALAGNSNDTGPFGRSNSPLFDRLKSTFRSSSRNSSRSAQSDDGKQSVASERQGISLPSSHLTSAAASRPQKSARRASEGPLTRSVNHSHFPVRPQGKEDIARPTPRQPSHTPAEEPSVVHSVAVSHMSTNTPPSWSHGLTVPDKQSRSGVLRSQSLSSRESRELGTESPSRMAHAPTSGLKSSVGRDREKVVFGTAWNQSLSTSASTSLDLKRSSMVMASPSVTSSGASAAAPRAIATIANSSSSVDAQLKPIKRSAMLHEGSTSTSTAAGPLVPEGSGWRKVSQSQDPAATLKVKDILAIQRKLAPPENTSVIQTVGAAVVAAPPSPKVSDVTEERLKKRSLRRRLSAPISAAKGLFEHKSF